MTTVRVHDPSVILVLACLIIQSIHRTYCITYHRQPCCRGGFGLPRRAKLLTDFLHFRRVDCTEHELLFPLKILCLFCQNFLLLFNLFLEILDLRTEARLSFLKCVGLGYHPALFVYYRIDILTGNEPTLAACCSLNSLSCSLMNWDDSVRAHIFIFPSAPLPDVL